MTRFITSFVGVVAALPVAALAAQLSPAPSVPADAAAEAKLLSSVVTVRVRAVAHARSNAELGRERAGTGVVADSRGHVLTSVFLVQEPDSIALTTADGRTVPATIAVEDHGTGVAILRPAAPLGVMPMPLGEAADLRVEEPVLIVSAAEHKEVTLAHVVAKREFAGNWEYLVDQALFTVPPIPAWAGAALVDGTGKLVGVGSLLLESVASDSKRGAAGNLFVPVALYRAALERLEQGLTQPPSRPWLGLITARIEESLVVLEVLADSPAARANLARGDVIVAVNGEHVSTHAELYRKLWSERPELEISLSILRDSRVLEIRLKPVDASDRLIQRAAR